MLSPDRFCSGIRRTAVAGFDDHRKPRPTAKVWSTPPGGPLSPSTLASDRWARPARRSSPEPVFTLPPAATADPTSSGSSPCVLASSSPRACPYRCLCLCVYSSDPLLPQSCLALHQGHTGRRRCLVFLLLCLTPFYCPMRSTPGRQQDRCSSVKKIKRSLRFRVLENFSLVLLRGKDLRVGDVGTGVGDSGPRAKEAQHRTSRMRTYERSR